MPVIFVYVCTQARKIEKAGAKAGIIVDNVVDSSAETWSLFAMSGDGVDDVKIPVVFLFAHEAQQLMKAATTDPDMEVTLSKLPAGIESSRIIFFFFRARANLIDRLFFL